MQSPEVRRRARSTQSARVALCALLAMIALAASSLIGAQEASAAGLFLPGHGVKPLGRAGAFVVSGEGDLNSLWHNPANLATLEELTLTVDLSLIDLAMSFKRAPRTKENGEVVEYGRVEEDTPPKPDPQILLGGSFNKKLKWGAGLYAPYLSGQRFPEKGPQRYTLIDNDLSLLLYLHFAVAYKLHDRVRIGAGVQNLVANFVFVNTTSGYTGLFGEPEDEDLDILTRATISSLFNPSGNAGVWVQLSDNVEAALSFQLPVRIRDDAAKVETRLPSHPAFDNATINGDTIATQLSLPFIARFGARFKSGGFDYELNLVYERWSSFEELQVDPNGITVENVPGIGAVAVAPLKIPMKWQDTYSVRNGFGYQISDVWAVRGGYTFETAAVPDEYYSVFQADGTKHVGTLGGSYAGSDWSLDASFAYYFIPDRTITSSKVRQINPTDPDNELTLVVGNGDYTQRFMIFGVGFNKKF